MQQAPVLHERRGPGVARPGGPTRPRTARWPPSCATRLAAARLGGAEKARARHVGARQAAAPRPGRHAARPGLPVPGAGAAGRRRACTTTRPRRAGVIAGIGRVAGREVRDRRQRRHRQGRHLLPDDGQEAPARPGGRAGEPAALHLPGRLRAAPSCPCRTRSSPTASTSAGSSTTRPGCPARGIPQIAAVLGSCTAGGAYVPAMSDEAVIVRGQGTIFLGGPPLVKAATGEVVTAEELGGGEVHARVSGVTDHLAEDDAHALRIVRDIVATLPAPRPRCPGRVEPGRGAGGRPARAVRRGARRLRARPYDVREVIARLVDGSRFPEFKARVRHDAGHRLRARSTATRSASSPTTASCSPSPRSKGAHFIELCDQRGIPLVFLQNIIGLHGRPGLRGRRHRQARRQDGHRGGLRPGAQAHRGHRRLVRRGQLLDVRAGLLARASCGCGRTPGSP